jgi:Family of unknown function (DUF6328)
VARLKDMIQNALDELRMLVLGLQVLIGFGYRAVLEPQFEKLPRALQLVELASLTLLLVAFAVAITPAAVHRLVEHGEDTRQFHQFTTLCADVVLAPIAVGVSLELAVAALKSGGPRAAMIVPSVIAAVALTMWYGIEVFARKDHPRMEQEDKPSELKDKIRHVLTEARVVLPGAQALLGFQFASTLIEGFDKLPSSLKWLHLASLCAVALSTILLITPAAWHRLVEHGENSEGFHRFASAMLMAALVPLALGLGGDFYLVTQKVTGSAVVAASMSAALGLVFFVLWFGIGLWRRSSPSRREALA